MEISLSEKDMESLSKLVADKIEKRVYNALVSDGAYEFMKDRARNVLDLHFTELNFKYELHEIFRKELLAEGSKLLRDIVDGAVRSVDANDEVLAKIVRQSIYSSALAASQKAAAALMVYDNE